MSPDSREHRGPHPEDRELFDGEMLLRLKQAFRELSWLLEHGYPLKASLKLVGDKNGLTDRQRLALSRVVCSEKERDERRRFLLPLSAVTAEHVLVDGFNLIITMEAALSKGLLLMSRDGCIRDLASVHSSYKSVQETVRAIAILGETLMKYQPSSVTWLLDSPVSNSGRLASKIRAVAEEKGWSWDVEVFFNPDTIMINSGQIVATSDSAVISKGVRWVNLIAEVILANSNSYWLVDFAT
ncbi:MAG: DUF434 domain-containing protein [Acidobacteriota bacterium]|nr:DUF434 domain-containing protein [Blastocatellia bacterium]MDW8411730.1 DUF434 domain-containing protein [Acidobacteriota bacterium]